MQRKRIDVKPENRKKIEDFLFGDYDTALRAKRSLNLTITRAKQCDPAEARALMKLKRKLRV